MNVKGMIFDIQHFSIHDGPGIRTLVFLKGCNLRCRWCSNPEGQNHGKELFYQPKKCIGCWDCIEACPKGVIFLKKGQLSFNRERCDYCAKCIEACNTEALVIKGKEVYAHDVLKEIMKDMKFYEISQGGVTLGGGEPLLQSNFAVSILKACKEKGIHTTIETAGYVPWTNIEQVIPFTDLFLYDIKHMDPKIHEDYTGVDNITILSNLEKLAKKGCSIIVRTPIIPNFNNNEDEISKIIHYIKKIGIKKYDLIPYHNYGKNKYYSLGRVYRYSKNIIDKKILQYYREKIINQGLESRRIE
ncbi:MAG: glycyl-radical enzyme activating protein [Eubacteriaceae bacterium]